MGAIPKSSNFSFTPWNMDTRIFILLRLKAALKLYPCWSIREEPSLIDVIDGDPQMFSVLFKAGWRRSDARGFSFAAPMAWNTLLTKLKLSVVTTLRAFCSILRDRQRQTSEQRLFVHSCLWFCYSTCTFFLNEKQHCIIGIGYLTCTITFL